MQLRHPSPSLAPCLGDLLLGWLLGCGLSLCLRLLLGLLHHYRQWRLLPQDTVIAVLEVDDVGAVTLKSGRSRSLAALGQDQAEVTLVLGVAEKTHCTRPVG